jgi:prolipoprotein diacylglyceryl transferase
MHPILFQIGSITVRYYGLMYVIAITVGFFLLSREVRRKKLALSTDNLLDLLLWTVPVAIIGARLYYVVFHWNYYGTHPLDIFKLWQGGLAIHGGVLAGILVVYLFSRLKKVQFWALTDALAPSLILGQAIGRIGNFTNGDAFGLPTTLPWGIRFPAGSPAGMAFPGQATHPSMIYEMLLNLAIFAFLWSIRKKRFRDGFSTAMYFILYAVARSIVSFTRADSLWLGPIRAAHAISIAFVILFGVMIWRRKLYVTELESSSGRKLSPK